MWIKIFVWDLHYKSGIRFSPAVLQLLMINDLTEDSLFHKISFQSAHFL